MITQATYPSEPQGNSLTVVLICIVPITTECELFLLIHWLLMFFFFFFGCTRGMQKFLGQGLNHRCNQSHGNDNAGSFNPLSHQEMPSDLVIYRNSLYVLGTNHLSVICIPGLLVCELFF